MKINIPDRYNASLLVDEVLESGRGDRLAIVAGDERVTYSELFQRN